MKQLHSSTLVYTLLNIYSIGSQSISWKPYLPKPSVIWKGFYLDMFDFRLNFVVMENRLFSSAEIAEAEMWVRLRLLAIGSYCSHLDGWLEEAVREICAIVYRYNGAWVSPSSFSFRSSGMMRVEIEEVLRRLRETIASSLEEMASFDEEEADAERRSALADVLALDMERMEDETEALVTCGLLLGYDEAVLAGAIVSAMDDPWESDIFRTGREAGIRYGTVNSIVIAGGVSYGVGHSNVSSHMLDMTGTAFLTNVFGDKQLASHPDAREFLSVTADARACDNCVDEASRGWQPIGNYVGPWHPNCRCHFFFR